LKFAPTVIHSEGKITKKWFQQKKTFDR
jgi:hypothetical protein